MRSLLSDNQHEYSDNQIESLVSVNIFGATLSLLGACFIIGNFCIFASLRKVFAFKLVLMVGVSDAILSISNLMGAPDHGSACYAQAILQQIGDISSILWVTSISWTINKLTKMSVTRIPTQKELKVLYVKMNVIIWSIALIFTLLPFTTDSYGVAGGWCWIQGYDPIDNMWRYLCFYLPLWIAIIYMIVIYIQVYKRLKEQQQQPIGPNISDEEEELQMNTTEQPDAIMAGGSSIDIEIDHHSSSEDLQRKLDRKKSNTLSRMKFYPMILILCYSFATIRRILDWATSDQTPYFLAILHTFFAAIPGFLNAIVYGFTKDVQLKDKQALNRFCGCKFKVDSLGTIHEQITERDSDDTNL